MPLDFPNTPTQGQVWIASNGVAYVFDGTKWIVQPTSPSTGTFVNTFNTRAGNVTLLSADVTGALGYTPYNASNPSGYIAQSAADARYLQLSGGSVTGAVTFTGPSNQLMIAPTTGTSAFVLNSPVGNSRQVRIQSGGSDRWVLQATSTAEGSGNSGSDIDWRAYDNNGSYLYSPIQITRSSGTVTFNSTFTTTMASGRSFYTQSGLSVALSGSTVPPMLANFGTAGWSGTSTIANNTSLASVNIGTVSDNASLPPGGARNELLIAGSYGGTAFSGGRSGMFVQMNWNTASPAASSVAALVGYASVVTGNVNVGGTATGFGVTQFGNGQLFGSNPWAKLANGATYWGQVVGTEIDISLDAGSSCNGLAGLGVVVTNDHQVKAAFGSTGINFSAQVGAAANIDNGYSIGGFGAQWPLDGNTGYVFRSNYSQNNVDPHCAGGIDLLHLIPDGTTGKYGGGFTYRGPGSIAASAMDGTGAWKIGTGYISAVAGGLNIDASLYVLTGTPTVAAGGSGYGNNDKVTDSYGNLFVCTAAGGVVSAVTVLQRAEGSTANRTGVVATNMIHRTGSGFGTGLTLNETWTQATNLSLNPSGGAVTINAGCTITSGSAAPAATQPAGSIYMRTGGASGGRLYVSAGGGTWTAIAGV